MHDITFRDYKDNSSGSDTGPFPNALVLNIVIETLPLEDV
jgi:hypothetical protein